MTSDDGVPLPKVIDFGIAKATAGIQLTDKTLFTRFEMFIGTPAYMSPEQAGLGGLDVDARSDVYSLGALLYELLTGAAPFDAKTLSTVPPDEARRLIREQDPLKPSARLGRWSAEQLAAIAERRGADAARLQHQLQGDLDRVVMKALEKDRTRRYPTAAALAEDLQRYLDGAPVNAHAPSAAYLLRKFAARHRVAFAAGLSVALALVLASVVSIGQAVKASRAQQRAAASERLATNALAQIEQINTRLERDNYRAAIQLAQARIEAGQAHAAMPVLWAAPEKLRGWEWGHLMAQCPMEEMGWDAGHGAITHLELLADGKRLLTAGEDSRLRLWDISSRRRLVEASSDGRIRTAGVAPDHRHVAVVSFDGTHGRLTIFELERGAPVFQAPLPNFEANPVWTKDGLLVIGHHGLWRVAENPWRVAERHPGFYPSTLPSAKATLGLGPNPPLLLPSDDGFLRSIETATLRTNATLYSAVQQGASRNLLAFLIEPAAQRFAYALDRVVWARLGGAPLRPIFTNDTAIRFLKAWPGTDEFAVASDSLSVLRHDGSMIARWAVPHGLRQLALAPDGRVVIGDSSGFIRFYRPAEMNQVRHLVEVSHERECRNVSFSPPGDRLAFMDWRREASFHLPAAALLSAPAGHPPARERLATPDASGAYQCFSEVPGFHPTTGEYVATSTNGLVFYDTASGTLKLTRQLALRGRPYSVSFAREGATLLASHGSGVDWVDLSTGETRFFDFPGNATVPVALSADGQVGASMARTKGEEHIVWRIAGGEVLWRQPVQDTPNDLGLHPGGNFVALGFYEGRTEVWDVRTGRLVQRFPSGSPVWGLRFCGRDGNRLIALSEQREIHFWDWQFGHELLRLRTSYLPFAAAFSPDGLTLAIASHNPGVTLRLAVPWSAP